MKILVCGSRDWSDREAIVRGLRHLPEGTVVIVGDARGADAIATELAAYYGYEIHPHEANWARYGRRAGPIRNRAMLDEAPDRVLAFQLRGSRGTQDTVDEARRRGIPVEVIARPGS